MSDPADSTVPSNDAINDVPTNSSDLSSVEDILEKRIIELEKKIFGSDTKNLPTQVSLPENTIIDSLAHVNTLVSSALSGRDKINTLIARLPELESYAANDYEPPDHQIDAKLEYILASESEIRENINQLTKFEELLPVTENDYFNNLPEMTENLHVTSLKYIELNKETENLTKETREVASRYNDIMKKISQTLINLDLQVSALEEASKPKKLVD